MERGELSLFTKNSFTIQTNNIFYGRDNKVPKKDKRRPSF